MTELRSRCRHWQEPRQRWAAFCHSPHLVGSRLVTPSFCEMCPYHEELVIDVEGAIGPDMSVAALAALLEDPPRAWPAGWEDWPVTADAHYLASDRFLHRLGEFPAERYRGRGIVIAGGGQAFFASLYVTIRAIRAVGCRLPVEVWFLGRNDEMPDHYARVLTPYDVVCVDGDVVRRSHPCRILNGWELKVFALLHCPFEEVLLLDADCYPVHDPSFIFEDLGYRERGAIFWPDIPRSRLRDWTPFRVQAPRGQESIESGQVVINKRQCWRPVQLAWWYNDHSEWTYLHGYGDKHTFEVAWARLGVRCQRFQEAAIWLRHVFVHLGPGNRALFIHRCRDKFRLAAADYLGNQHAQENCFHAELPLERECFAWLADLAKVLGEE